MAVSDLPEWLRGADRVTLLTGAGISTGSGIPDYRGPSGEWTVDPAAQNLSSFDHYVSDGRIRRLAWLRLAQSPMWHAEPNAAHRAAVALEHQGRLRALITQNVDGLHARAGTSPDRLIELHGNEWETVCLDCGAVTPTHAVLERVRLGDEDPHCVVCEGLLKTGVISFGQEVDDRKIADALASARDCDVFIAAGTSLRVAPATWLPSAAQAAGARLVIANGEPTPLDDDADLVVRTPLETALPHLLVA